jgi:hypothetical protein
LFGGRAEVSITGAVTATRQLRDGDGVVDTESGQYQFQWGLAQGNGIVLGISHLPAGTPGPATAWVSVAVSRTGGFGRDVEGFYVRQDCPVVLEIATAREVKGSVTCERMPYQNGNPALAVNVDASFAMSLPTAVGAPSSADDGGQADDDANLLGPLLVLGGVIAAAAAVFGLTGLRARGAGGPDRGR